MMSTADRDRGQRSEPVRSIAVVRALALGDLLCAVPALRAIRARYPMARISLVGLPWARELVDRYPSYLDEFIEFPGFPGIPERPVDPGRTTSFLAQMQTRAFDLAVQLQGDGSWINAFVVLFGAGDVAGFHPVGWPPLATAGTWIPYPGHGSEVRRLLALPSALGAPLDETLEFPIRDDDRTALAAGLPRHLEPGSYAAVHPGASTPVRRWPARRFAAVADQLSRAGLQVVLTGSAAEAAITTEVTAGMRHRPIDLAGRTTLGALAALLRDARIVLTNDTGISHLAAAVSTPSVVVFSGSERERWAPIDGVRHRVVERWPDQAGPDGWPRVEAVAQAVERQLASFEPSPHETAQPVPARP